jgi:hypothetical protein
LIAYSQMTYGQAYDEVVLRLNNFRIAENVSYLNVVYALNHSIKEAMSLTLPYKDWAYTTTVGVVHRQALPRQYLGYIRVLLSATGQAPFAEARYVDPKEWWSLTDWYAANSWTKGLGTNPIFTVWAVNGVPTFFCYPNTDFQTGTAPMYSRYVLPTEQMSGLMEYYHSPDELILDTDVLNMPYEFEEFIILGAVWRVASKVLDEQLLQLIHQSLNAEKEKIYKLATEKKRTEKRDLDSFVEPVIPLVPPQQDKTEVPRRLV